MATLDDVKRMQGEGRTEQEISQTLQQQGVPQQEIDNTFAQSKIKDAVTGSAPQAPQTPETAQISPEAQVQEATSQMPPAPTTEAGNAPLDPSQSQPEYPIDAASGMSPSMLTQEQTAPVQEGYTDQSFQTMPYDQQYQPYQSSISPDTVTEIAEQAIAEKISPLTSKIEKAIDFKSTFESKISSIDDRLKRIEKIIDKLQLSVLQKVGQYVTDVSDLKQELVETQKSFKSIHSKHPSKSNPSHKTSSKHKK